MSHESTIRVFDADVERQLEMSLPIQTDSVMRAVSAMSSASVVESAMTDCRLDWHAMSA